MEGKGRLRREGEEGGTGRGGLNRPPVV